MRFFFFTVVITLFMNSCSSDYDKRLKISATTWIGYTPLFYAQEKGWLKSLNIKLLSISSLAENMYIYQTGNSDAYTGTQYEFSVLKNDIKSLRPIMMFDRSNGGDLIMSNLSIKELQKTTVQIDAYLEMDSINSLLLKDFLEHNNLAQKDINYLNQDQIQIKELRMSKEPTLIVTYAPYNLALQRSGYKEVASTKNALSLVVVDALFTRIEVYQEHKKQFDALKKLVDKSIESLQKDPHEFYETVKPYLLDMCYKEFSASLDDIIWINKEMDNQLKERLVQMEFPIKELIK